MVAKRKDIKADVEAMKKVLPQAYDADLEYVVALYHADAENATYADADKVRQAIKKMPSAEKVEVLRSQIERLLIAVCVSGKGSRVVLEQECQNMRKQFGYDEASGIEKAIIDRIVLCWLRLQRYEKTRAALDVGSNFISHMEHAERQLHLAHSRYMRSIEELAKVQFLMARTSPTRLAVVRAVLNGEATPPVTTASPREDLLGAVLIEQQRRRKLRAKEAQAQEAQPAGPRLVAEKQTA